MAITYKNKPIDWDNEGTTPPQDLIETGFLAGYKPPAEYFNAILHTNAEAIKELQEKTADFSVTVDGYMIDSGFIDATCTYAADTGYTLTFDTDVSSASYFCIRFKAPNKYVADATFTIGTTAYTAVNASFEANDVVILNFDKVQQKCFFAGGGNVVDGNECIIYSKSHNLSGNIWGSIIGGQYQSFYTNIENSLVIGNQNYTTDDDAGYIGNIQNSMIGGRMNKIKHNTSSYCDIITGYQNTIDGGKTSNCNIISGLLNTISGDIENSIITGTHNTVSLATDTSKEYYVPNVLCTGANNELTFSEVKTEANKTYVSSAAIGTFLIAKEGNTAVGKYNKTPTVAKVAATTGDLFVIGNGLSTARSNAFRVTSAGDVMGTKAYTASGADYAELFEYADGNANNEDRRGLFVTLDGEKIRLANADDDYILGVVSATPSVVADAHTDDWCKKWKTDIFGERLLDENGAWILNEDFKEEENESYVSRLDRKEWAAVGLVGKLIVVDDGTCEVNGYCYPKNGGVATKTDKGYRVIARIDESHVKVVIK